MEKDQINNAYNNVITTIKSLLTIYGIYLLWILLHYIASHLYIKFCVPLTFTGFLLSPIIMTSQYCISLRWVIYNAGNNINNMWIAIGTFISQKLII
jgi:hypothetical protein